MLLSSRASPPDATAVTAAALEAPAVPTALVTGAIAAMLPTGVAAVRAALDVRGRSALGLAGLGDAGQHGEGSTKSETTDGDLNQLVHGVHLSP